ncbi:hypothetical protein [Streptomyces sp. NPDC002962]|uniref:hypothetical protein n=1 Tax=Streptomyces sp. NPDC002962 TaxID=3364674 RepID=UPI003677D876
MKSDIIRIERWKTAEPQRADTLCSTHGKKSCDRPLVADVYVSDKGSQSVHWTVCQVWLDNEPDVAEYDRLRP